MTDAQWRKIALFTDLTDEELALVQPLFTVVLKQAGEYVIEEGEKGDEMFILVKGRVRVTKAMILKGMKLPLAELKDPRKVLATVDSNKYPIFGEMALFDHDVRSATVEAIDDSEFLVTNRDRFYSMIDTAPALLCRLFIILGRRMSLTVRKSNSELVKLTTALALALTRQ
ncbi:MAG: cyclic nucleotide-binding domain-containing protein [Desulfovibrio sp.]|nr:MAG: cyclic nucleotide-binding domain-containing protein [Desulfovibrio sp.]